VNFFPNIVYYWSATTLDLCAVSDYGNLKAENHHFIISRFI